MLNLNAYEPNSDLQVQFEEFARDFQNGEKFYAEYYRPALENFSLYIADLELKKMVGILCSPDTIPVLTRWYTDSSGAIVGTGRLRLSINDYVCRTFGHVGFDVRPSFRTRGYASQILLSLITLARDNNIPRILVICDTTNVLSQKTILRCGGVFEDQIISEFTKNPAYRYWIETEL